jgi:MoxR-like ATPase
VIVERMTGSLEPTQQVIDTTQLIALQRMVDAVYVDPALIEYVVRVVGASRDPASVGLTDLARYVTYGASPRASINMILAAKALAFVRGRHYALPMDVRDLALDVLRHRVVLSYEALADDVSADQVLSAVLGTIALPEVPLHERRPRPGPPPLDRAFDTSGHDT